jgi:hypothetical protein
MRTFFRNVVQATLTLAIAILTAGCAFTTPVQNRIDGYTKRVPDSSPRGSHEVTYKPQPLYTPLLFITVPLDIVTYPLQIPFLPCIANFYDISICDLGDDHSHDALAAIPQPLAPSATQTF